MEIGPYTGDLAPRFRSGALQKQLAALPALLKGDGAVVLQDGRNRNVKVSLDASDAPVAVVVKAFGVQSGWKDSRARKVGSKAKRTWEAARHLEQNGVGTPAPIGFLERWDGDRLLESYYLAEFLPGMSNFRDELGHLLYEEAECDKLMALLHGVARAVAAMHGCGFQHRDLGNQNIMLKRLGPREWGDVRFIDLNRARVFPRLSDAQRARDISRLAIPSDLLRVFRYMYLDGAVPPDFVKLENRFRQRYGWHSRTRRWRHPIREARIRRRESGRSAYPPGRDTWIWDERSAQTINAFVSCDKRKLYPFGRHLRIAGAALCGVVPVWRQYQSLLAQCYAVPVEMANRIGLAVDPREGAFDRQKELLAELGPIPLLVRFHRHHTLQQWNRRIEMTRELAAAGHPVSLALLQDRAAVKRPELWATFVSHVVGRLGDTAEYVELGHAINRAKWGIWEYGEYGGLLKATAAVTEWLPDVKFCGPAVIDFEYPDVVAALRQVPPAMTFSALSHHLYVDRRGAPENRQGRFATLEKLALARAIARWSPACEDRLIISEVNWPVAGTGEYSPVGSPYVTPEPRPDDPSVSEDDYASYMVRYLLIASCSGMAERVYWWRLVARGFGLVDDSDEDAWRSRPAYHALVQFVRKVGSARFLKKLDAGAPKTHVFLFELPGGQPLMVAYTEETSFDWHPPARVLNAENRDGQPLSLDGAPVRLTGSPVYVLTDAHG